MVHWKKEVDKTEEYVSKGLTEGFIKIEEFVLANGTGSSTAICITLLADRI